MHRIAGTPRLPAAAATACAWLPALAATTPFWSDSRGSLRMALTAPRILNEPVSWRFSVFRKTRGSPGAARASAGSNGVSLTRPWSLARASSMSATVTT
jgi:hypothetical protein